MKSKFAIPGRALLIVAVGVAVILSAAGTSSLYATNYDLNDDWSDLSNPNGVWSLVKNHEGDLFTTNQPDYYNDGSNQNAWADDLWGTLAHVPYWMKWNDDGLIYAHTPEFDRTGTDYTSAVWTSPLAGPVEISGELWSTWVSGRELSWQLKLNGTIISSALLVADGTYDENNPFDLADGSGGAAALTQTVEIGDTLELGLVSISENGNLGDEVGLEFTILPEPSSLALLGVGVLALVRRKIRQ